MSSTIGIIRTPTGVLQTEADPVWGITLQPGKDPQGVDVPQAALDAIRLPDNFPRLPRELWNAFRDLCFRFLNWQSTEADLAQEVAVIWTRSGPDFGTWEGWVPTQSVGGAVVDSDLRVPLMNLLTGERFDSLSDLVATGRRHAGSAHSHNTMGAFFSSRDDGSEKGVPGIHCVLGKCERVSGSAQGRTPANARIKYDVAPSVVLLGKRYETVATSEGIRDMEPGDLIDLGEQVGRYGSRTFHRDVLGVVTKAPLPSLSVVSCGGSDCFSWGLEDAPGFIRGVVPCAAGSDYAWVQRSDGQSARLEKISGLPAYWQGILLGKSATQQPPAIGTPALGLFRAKFAQTEAQAHLLANMVGLTLNSEESPREAWVTLLKDLSRLGFEYTPPKSGHTG